MCTILLEFTGSVGLWTSTRRTGLLELTGCKGLLELTVRRSTLCTKLLELNNV